MKIEKQELLDSLTVVRPGLASREVTEEIGATYFIFKAGRVHTYNDEQAISHPVPKGLKIDGSVQAEGLYSLLNKTKEKEIEVSVEGGELRVNGRRSKAGLFLLAEAKAPLSEVTLRKGDKWSALPEEFSDALDLCLVSVGEDMTKPILTCIHVSGRWMESSDDFRLGRYQMSKRITPFLLPAISAKELIKYKPTEYCVAKNGWVHFKTEEDTIISCRTLAGKYPDLSRFTEVKGQKIRLPENLVKILEKADLFLKDEHGGVQGMASVKVDEGWAVIRAEGAVGWFEEKIRIGKKDISKISFRIKPLFLIDMIARHSEVVIGEMMMKFEAESFVHCIALSIGT